MSVPATKRTKIWTGRPCTQCAQHGKIHVLLFALPRIALRRADEPPL